MEIWLAFTSFDEMEKSHKYPIMGVLTNPTLLTKPKLHWEDVIKRLNSIGKLPLGLQVVSTSEGEMMEEIQAFRRLVDRKELIFKIPVCAAGLKIVPLIRELGHRINMAAICTFNQAVIVLETEIDYLSIYVGRVTDSGGDGIDLVRQIKDYAAGCGKTVIIQAASIRTVEQFEKAAHAGADAIVVPCTLLEEALQSNLTDQSIQKYANDWAGIQ
jgi:TalC/MipB family fructose-6-phosphate aldolase